ncbi:MAG: hypothetical protein Q8K48_01040 [Candidatus Planktophila sp.]|nr:hypothetical protein [Candidatus Planktophila sp.]
MKRLLALIGVFASTLLPFTSSSQAADNDSFIVGTWNTATNGAITISGSNGFYEGIVSSAFQYSGCDQKIGELMIKILGNGSGSLAGDGLSFLGSFQANTASSDCKPSTATAEFKVKDLKSIFELNACPSWGSDCLNLRKQGPSSDTQPPKITFQPNNLIAPMNSAIYTLFYIYDSSGKASYRTDIYSDGLKLNKETAFWSTTSGDPVMSSFQPTVIAGANGPFYVCVVAYDASGNMTGDFDNCQWRSIEVPIEPMTNGCGSQDKGVVLGWVQNFLLNEMKIRLSIKDALKYNRGNRTWFVNVKPACDNHDAGYFGATFKDAVVSGKIIESRLSSRAYVDEKFRQDIMLLCKRSKGIPKAALAICLAGETYAPSKVKKLFLRDLPTGATTYWSAVRAEAKNGYDADSTKPGFQTSIPKNPKPAGGARNNA